MTKQEFEETYLGKSVAITMRDGDYYLGYLQKTGTDKFKDTPNFYLPKEYFFLTTNNNVTDKAIRNMIFKFSHIKNIEIIYEKM